MGVPSLFRRFRSVGRCSARYQRGKRRLPGSDLQQLSAAADERPDVARRLPSRLRFPRSSRPPFKRQSKAAYVWPSLCGIISVAIRNNQLPPDPLHSARVLPALRTQRSHRRAGSMRATAIVMVIVVTNIWASWWRGVSHPPPSAWRYVFEEFTGDGTADEWALAAAIFIARYRRRHSQGPTFREVFEHLLPDTEGVPSRLPSDWDVLDRRRANSGFRKHVAIEWRRRGYIGFDRHVTRSLRVGPRFREQSRALNAVARKAVDMTEAAARAVHSEPSPDSLSAEEARALLRITPTALRRLSRRGYLHAVESDAAWRYPSWQFSGRPTVAVVPGIERVAPAVPKLWSFATLNSFMTTPRRELDVDGGAVSPVDWLIRGHDPHRIVQILISLEVRDARHATSS